MDSLTQAVLGAGVQGAILGKYQGRKSLLYGAFLGTLPDLDVLIHYADPIERMTYHRGFSHSLLVLSALAWFLTWLIRRYRPNPDYGFGRLFISIWLALVTHTILDAFTVYGTQLFWPFSPTPQQWSGVFIVDPLYTLPMLGAVVYALLTRCSIEARRWIVGTLLWGCLYLAWGTYGQYYHQQRVQAALNQQGIAVHRIMATPMPANTLLYRVVAQSDDGQYIEAVSGWLDHNPPEWIALPQGLALIHSVPQSPQLKRLQWFADDWLRYDIQQNQLIATDLRMGTTGRHLFRFVVAQQDEQGQWHAIPTRRYPNHWEDNIEPLFLIWQRIWNDDKPLPLQKWADSAG